MQTLLILLLAFPLVAYAADGSSKAPPAAASPTPTGPSICGTVKVDPKLVAKLKPSASLFIFAKSHPGGGPPNAVQRHPVEHFPLSFCLSASDAMIPGMEFKGDMFVTARIRQDGTAGPAGPGDLEGGPKDPVSIGTKDLTITLDAIK